MSVGNFAIAVSPMTRIASARTITACGFFSAALTIGFCASKAAATAIYYKRIASALTVSASHSSQYVFERWPWPVADNAHNVIIDKARRELITARVAASDRIAGFQFSFRLGKTIDLAFLENDHRHGGLAAVTQNQRDRHAFNVAQTRAA